MSDVPQTAEAVAYALMREIAVAEGVRLAGDAASTRPADRTWILETFAECLKCVRADAVKAAPTHGRSSY